MDRFPNEKLVQLRAFARIDGALLGVLWIVSFACFIGEFSFPSLGMLSMLLALCTPVLVAMRLRKFRDGALYGHISFRRGLAYCFYTFLYASLIFALAQYVYFAYIDGGYIINRYSELLSSPETKPLLDAYGITKTQIDDAITTFQSINPIGIAFNFLTMNILAGAILSPLVAAVMKREDIYSR